MDTVTQPHRTSGIYSDGVTENGFAGDILDLKDSLRKPATAHRKLSSESWSQTNGDHDGNLGNGRTVSPMAEKRPRAGKRRESGIDRKKEYGGDLIYQRGNPWTSDKETILMAPFDYLDAIPGKDVRSQLIAAFNAWLRVPRESLEVITKVVGMLHTASLL